MSETGPIGLRFEGALAVATLQRPPVNAIDDAWIERFEQVVGEVGQSRATGALLLRSGERAFCAGADLALMRSRFDTAEGRAAMVAFARRLQQAFARLEALPQATIAEIGGAAMGGGLELALACDLRVASAGARLGLTEARLGLLPGAGGTQRLPRIAGEAVARRMILRGEAIDGAEAARLGVVHWTVPAAQLAARASELAGELAAMPAAAIAACKRCLGARLEGVDGYAREIEGTAALYADAETQRRVRAFLKRK
jgi:enoyl-CoA hydratase